MKDPMIDNLAERFADHAVDVDPGTWSAISGKLAVASGSSLGGLLKEKFAGHETPVDPQVWTNISSQLGHGAAAGAGGTTAWWAAGIAASIVAGGFLLYNLPSEPATTSVAEKAPIIAPMPPHTQPVAAVSTTPGVSDPSTSLTPETPDMPAAGQPNLSDGQPDTRAGSATPSRTGSAAEQAGGANTSQGTTEHIVVPASSTEGQKTVNTVLQSIVDEYVTSPIVVVTEPKVPPPTQEEMPSQAVHPQRDEPEPDQQEPVEPEIIEAAPAAALTVMIPTAFSPNGDGVNDELAVMVQNYQRASVRIFSASSNALVFSADNLEAKWNGRLMNSGQPCEPGMYFYALEVTDADGRTWSKGEVVRLFKQ